MKQMPLQSSSSTSNPLGTPAPPGTPGTPRTPRNPGRSGRTPGQQGNARLVLVALGLALAAVVMTNFYIEVVRRQADDDAITVYVLTRPVSPGDRIREQHVEPLRFPSSFRESFTTIGAMDRTGLDVRLTEGRAFQRTGSSGDFLTYRLFEAPADREVDRRINRGKRLVSLPVNPRTAPGGLREGMYVDIEAPFLMGGVTVVQPIMEYVRVFALGSRTAYDDPDTTGRRSSNYRTISVEVEPHEATQLSMIERMAAGEFELHLRNPADRDVPKIPAGGINPAVLVMIERIAQQQSSATPTGNLPGTRPTSPGSTELDALLENWQ